MISNDAVSTGIKRTTLVDIDPAFLTNTRARRGNRHPSLDVDVGLQHTLKLGLNRRRHKRRAAVSSIFSRGARDLLSVFVLLLGLLLKVGLGNRL